MLKRQKYSRTTLRLASNISKTKTMFGSMKLQWINQGKRVTSLTSKELPSKNSLQPCILGNTQICSTHLFSRTLLLILNSKMILLLLETKQKDITRLKHTKSPKELTLIIIDKNSKIITYLNSQQIRM